MPTPAHTNRVWDPFVRIFHWSVVACVILNLFVLEEGDAPHRWVGYAASGLVLARVLWGFIGTRHARFADFFPTPRRLRAYVQALLQGQFHGTPGHNPLGGLMVLLLLSLLLAVGLTGWLQGTDLYWGEEWVEELHEGLANGLLLAAGLHALAAVVMSRLERVGLIRAMVTGRKEPL